MSSDKRVHRRYAVEVAAEVDVGADVLVASTMNVSNGGVGLSLDRPLEEGKTVGVMLFLTQDGIEDPDEEPFEAQAEVMWATEQEAGRYIAGVRFGTLDRSQEEQLQRFLVALEG